MSLGLALPDRLSECDIRDGKSLDGLALELGDVLWYISTLADDLGVTLEEVAKANIEKLQSRMERNKIKGDGDNR